VSELALSIDSGAVYRIPVVIAVVNHGNRKVAGCLLVRDMLNANVYTPKSLFSDICQRKQSQLGAVNPDRFDQCHLASSCPKDGLIRQCGTRKLACSTINRKGGNTPCEHRRTREPRRWATAEHGRLAAAQANLAEIKAAKLRGALVETAAVEVEWADVLPP
jgi:hypothetical protein